MESPQLSLVLRATTNGERLAQAVVEAMSAAARASSGYELIIVDDGGDEALGAVAGRLAATHQHVALIRHQRRRGYRRSLYDAWSVAQGQIIVARDLDGAAGAGGIARLLDLAPTHAVVLGYREPGVAWPAAWGQRLVARVSGAPDLRDPLLGLACFRTELRDLLSPDGPDAMAHATIYAGARQRGLAVSQIAVPPRSDQADLTSQTQRAALAGSVAALLGGLWLLRRRRR